MDRSQSHGTFLPSLTRAFKSLDTEAQINTRAFVEAVESVLPVFDDLGEFAQLTRLGCFTCGAHFCRWYFPVACEASD